MELSLPILVCIHKSYIVYLEIYVVPIGHSFSFLVMENSWKINVEKEGAPCITVGDRAFPVTGSRLWNSLPHVVTSAPTLAVYRNRLTTYLYCRSFTHWL